MPSLHRSICTSSQLIMLRGPTDPDCRFALNNDNKLKWNNDNDKTLMNEK